MISGPRQRLNELCVLPEHFDMEFYVIYGVYQWIMCVDTSGMMGDYIQLRVDKQYLYLYDG